MNSCSSYSSRACSFLRTLFSPVVALLLLFSIWSCGSSGNSGERVLVDASGKNAQVIVFCDSSVWTSPLGDTIQDILMAHFPMALEYTPYFSLVRFQPEHFSNILRTNKNILIISKSDENTLRLKKEVWSKTQRVANLEYTSTSSGVELLKEKGQSLFDFFYFGDLKRIQQQFLKTQQEGINERLRSKKGLEITIPAHFPLMIDSGNAQYYKSEKYEVIQGIMYYETPYTDSSQFSNHSILNTRDSIAKQLVSGSLPGSFMQTHRRVETDQSILTHHGMYTKKTVGRWIIKKMYIGGIFINYTILDPNRNVLIHLDGFLYCPLYDQMFYLRELEAILQSIRPVAHDDSQL